MNMEELGKRIRSQREKRRLRQNDVANALQVTPQAVSKWERGGNAPDIGLLVALARLLGVSVEWLLGAYEQEQDVFEASILASGAQNARAMSEALGPREFAAWANGVCLQMTQAVLRHDGVPVKYMGPGILAFFSGGEHSRRAMSAAIGVKRVAAGTPVKAALSGGRIYFGPIGHPDYAQKDVMGEAVSIALLSMDWAAINTSSGVCACATTAEGAGKEFRLGPPKRARFERISHEVVLREVKC